MAAVTAMFYFVAYKSDTGKSIYTIVMFRTAASFYDETTLPESVLPL